MPVDASAHDPYRGFKFRVLIPGFPAEIGFQSISGLTEESEVVEYREGTDPITMRKLPGLTSYENIVLSRGLSSSDDILRWRAQVGAHNGRGDGIPAPNFRRNITIQLFDKGNDSKPVKEWEVFDCWPATLSLGDIDAGSSDVLIETMELAHEGFRQKTGAVGQSGASTGASSS